MSATEVTSGWFPGMMPCAEPHYLKDLSKMASTLLSWEMERMFPGHPPRELGSLHGRAGEVETLLFFI